MFPYISPQKGRLFRLQDGLQNAFESLKVVKPLPGAQKTCLFKELFREPIIYLKKLGLVGYR